MSDQAYEALALGVQSQDHINDRLGYQVYSSVTTDEKSSDRIEVVYVPPSPISAANIEIKREHVRDAISDVRDRIYGAIPTGTVQRDDLSIIRESDLLRGTVDLRRYHCPLSKGLGSLAYGCRNLFPPLLSCIESQPLRAQLFLRSSSSLSEQHYVATAFDVFQEGEGGLAGKVMIELQGQELLTFYARFFFQGDAHQDVLCINLAAIKPLRIIESPKNAAQQADGSNLLVIHNKPHPPARTKSIGDDVQEGGDYSSSD